MRFRFELDDTDDVSKYAIKHHVVLEQNNMAQLDDVLALFSLFMRSCGYFDVEDVLAVDDKGEVIRT